MNSIIKISALTAVGCCVTSYVVAQKSNKLIESQDKPNIIVILVDDQGYGGIGCNPHIKPVSTPNIDKLAADGVRFTQGYSSGNVSSPTRAGLLTGKYQQSFGFYSLADPAAGGIPEDQKIISQYLKEAGYNTAAIGKWHVGDQIRNHPNNRGFDYFYGFIDGIHDYFNPIIGGSWSGWFTGVAMTIENMNPVVEMKYATYEYTDRAIDFISKNASRPFFLYMPYNAIHSPLQAPEDILQVVCENPKEPTKDERIYAMTVALDNSVGRIIETLNKYGIYDNTLIFYLSDNGGTPAGDVWELRGNKGSYYEGGIRVPFIISWPAKIPSGQIVTEPVISVDIAPTILSATGISQLDMQGVSLLPYVTGRKKDNIHDVLYWSSEKKSDKVEHNNFAVRKGKWKIVSDPIQVKDCDLYDLEADPQEKVGLKKKYPEKFKEMYATYLEWIDQMGVPITLRGHMRMDGKAMMSKYERNFEKRFGRNPRIEVIDINVKDK